MRERTSLSFGLPSAASELLQPEQHPAEDDGRDDEHHERDRVQGSDV